MKRFKWEIVNFNKKLLLKNIIFSLVIGFLFLFFGLFGSFIFLQLMPGDPVLPYLPAGPPDPDAYAYWRHELWLDRPFIIRFLRYIFDLFTGNWGISMSINRGQDVCSLLLPRTIRTIDLLILPTILGLVFGIIIAVFSLKFKKTWKDKVIQGLIILGISLPVFTLGIFMQNSLAYDLGLYPASGFKSSGYDDPEFITGFRIIDALISGEWYYISDYLYHLMLPIFCLSIGTIALITHQARSYNEKNISERSIISNTMRTIWIFGFIFSFTITIENIFSLNGLFEILLDAIRESDYYVMRSFIFLTLLISIIITLISNIIFSILNSLSFARRNSTESYKSIENKDETNVSDINTEIIRKSNTQKYLAYIYESPFTIIGLVILIGIVILASFPELISGYTLEEATTPIPFFTLEPPSEAHLLGTEEHGRDIFALILWGTQNALLFSFKVILFSLIGGIIFGLISSYNKKADFAIQLVLLSIYVIPPIILIIFITTCLGSFDTYLFPTMGFLLIPFFTRRFTHIPMNKKNFMISLKKLLIFIPLALGFLIFFYESLTFLRIIFAFPYISLGSQIAQGSPFIQTAPWATFWPSLFLFFIGMGFFLLYYGLKDTFLEGLESSRIYLKEG